MLQAQGEATMNTYLKLYGWLWETFRKNEFSLRDFNSNFPSPQAKKVVHDLISDGYLERVSRGNYRVKEPEEFVSKIVKENMEKEDILKESERDYAFYGNDAVSIWTEGYYHTGFTQGFKPVHIQVLSKDLQYWRKFFRQHDAEYVVEDESKTLFGLTYVLHPAGKLTIEKKDGMPVTPLNDTVKFCRENELTYHPALEYLDKKYKLKLFKQHQYITH